MKIAITGGAGFIGSRLTKAYLDDGHDVLVIDNDVHLPSALRHVTEACCQMAGGHVLPYDVTSTEDMLQLAFPRQTAGKPINLAGDIVEHLGEAEALEPPRGSGAQVSDGVVAIDDNRHIALQIRRRLPI